jgi:DNA-binding HxlR family transcriptional regulator
MGRTDFTRMRCPVARAMAVLGERWAILVLREAFYGTTRFDEFERNLGIAPNILSARLRGLVQHGLLQRAPGPGGTRHEYRLTEKGRDFFPAYVALKGWADRWMTGPEGPAVLLQEAATGREVTPPPLLAGDGSPLVPETVRVLPGPGASPEMRVRLASGSPPGSHVPGRPTHAAGQSPAPIGPHVPGGPIHAAGQSPVPIGPLTAQGSEDA